MMLIVYTFNNYNFMYPAYFILTLCLSLVASLVFGYFNEGGHPSGYTIYPVVGFIPAVIIALINVVFIRLAELKGGGGKFKKTLLGFPLIIFVLFMLGNDLSLMLWGAMACGGILPINVYLMFRKASFFS